MFLYFLINFRFIVVWSWSLFALVVVILFILRVLSLHFILLRVFLKPFFQFCYIFLFPLLSLFPLLPLLPLLNLFPLLPLFPFLPLLLEDCPFSFVFSWIDCPLSSYIFVSFSVVFIICFLFLRKFTFNHYCMNKQHVCICSCCPPYVSVYSFFTWDFAFNIISYSFLYFFSSAT